MAKEKKQKNKKSSARASRTPGDEKVLDAQALKNLARIENGALCFPPGRFRIEDTVEFSDLGIFLETERESEAA